MLATIDLRSSVTWPPLTFAAPEPPLTIVTSVWSAVRLASLHAFCTWGLASARCAAVTATFCNAPASGPDTPCNAGGSLDRSSPATSTLAYSWPTR